MADTKVTNLTASSAPAYNDVLLSVDVSDTSQGTSGTSKKLLLSNVNARTYNVFHYGVVGDGVADDTTAIQAAINAAAAASDGVVEFPAGSYKTTATLTITNPVTLRGAGAQLTTIVAATTWASGVLMTITSAADVTLQNLRFNGNYPTRTSGDIISITDCSDVRVQNCEFVNAPADAVQMVRIERVWIENNVFDTIYHSGVFFESPGAGNENKYAWIRNNYFKDVSVQAATGISAIHAHGTTTTNLHHHIWIENNIIKFVSNDGIGIGLDFVQYCTVRNNRIIGYGSGAGEGIAFVGHHNRIEGNVINGQGAAGIYLFADATYAPHSHNVIIGNIIWDCPQGIYIAFTDYQITGSPAEVDHLMIAHNICYDTASAFVQAYGLQVTIDAGVTATWNNVLIAWNDFRGNATGDLSIPAALQQAGAVIIGNLQDAADGGLQISGANLYRGPGRLWGVGGVAATANTLNGIIYRHRDTGAGAKIRILGQFSATEASQAAGIAIETPNALANTVKTHVLAWKGGAIVETGGSHVDGSFATFGAASSAFNGAHMRIGNYHLWVSTTDGKLYIKNGEPSSDQDGTIVGSQ